MPAPPDRHDFEVHMLCGDKTWDMGVWASWSILRFFPRARLYVHDDSTLSDGLMAQWDRVVPGAVFVRRDEADARVEQEIAEAYPNLYAWRCGYWSGPQVVDMHLYGESPKWLTMDTDVLCFREPVELFRLVDQDQRVYRYNRDTLGRSCYMATPEELERLTETVVPRAVNCGFGLTDRFTEDDFARLDGLIDRLKSDPAIRPTPSFQSNTMYALVHTGFEAQPLPPDYDVYHGPGHTGQTIRHYVTRTETRARFFTEGLPDLWQQVRP
ncbi:MAG: hypothetical protein AAFX76_13345 [Planctomycetota bacterium]